MKEKEARKALELRQTLRRQQLNDLFGMKQVGETQILRRSSSYFGVVDMIMPIADISQATDEQWDLLIDNIQKGEYKHILEAEKEAQRIIDEKAEAERIAGLSERDQLSEYIEKIKAVQVPDLQTEWQIFMSEIKAVIKRTEESINASKEARV